MDSEVQFLSELSQQGDIAAAFVAERELAPYPGAVQVSEVGNERANEFFPRSSAERLIKSNEPGRVDTEARDDAQLLGQRIDQGWHAVRGHDRIGVPVERDGHCEGFVLLCIRQGL